LGNSVWAASAATLAEVPKDMPWKYSLVVVIVLTFLICFPVVYGLSRHRVGARSQSKLMTFLLDPESDTLSLSKFQVYVWLGVAVFGYPYLTLVRSLIQGVFQFAPIPEGLPGLLGISAGTTAVAAGLNSVRGPKGAGDEQPKWSDLITTGGVVVPERFQFLVWTMLGALAFLFLVVFSDPATIEVLPKVPEGFLYL